MLKRYLYLGMASLLAVMPSADCADFSCKPGEPSKSCPTTPTKPCDPCSHEAKVFEHRMQLYLADAYGVEVPGTDFWITLTVVEEKIGDAKRVTLQLPTIGFETGPFANSIYEIDNPLAGITLAPPPQNGGYLYTKDGFLPKHLRPSDLIPRTFFGASNNGQNIPFAYINSENPPPFIDGVSFTPPQPGYQIRVTNTGGLVIEGNGTLANIILPGTQQLSATDLSYIVKPYKEHICKNKRVSKGAINVAQYPFPPSTRGNRDNVRDHHFIDAYSNVVAYAWADNSDVVDPVTNSNTMHLAYSIGKVKDGELKMRKAKFLPTPDGNFVWCTSIAINRTDPDNIVIGYMLITPPASDPGSVTYAAVSFDGGKTWPVNGPTNVQPTGTPQGAGDLPGVRGDKYGNFWYMASNNNSTTGNPVNQPYLMVSSDKGLTWTLVYTFPYDTLSGIDFYDYPAFCFGGDGLGNYGVQMVADFVPGFLIGENQLFPARAFIPVTGLGAWGGPEEAFLPEIENNNLTASITASEDGRVWTYGSASGLDPGTYAFPGGFTNNRIVFKSPGPIDENYAGPWGVIRYNTLSDSIYYPVWEASPLYGFFQSVQTNLYDDKRQALYVILNATTPELSNNSDIYFLVSRNNGLTWSQPYKINTKNKNNRGFPSMQLDTKTGNVLVGWYDCRDYKDGLSFNYYGAVINKSTIDHIIKHIPLSNPLFSIPPGGYDIVPAAI